ncbi:MAG TPA: hypothetical protein VKK31_30610 [Thermoanaerobaculia bacterium]|nr:hypothetical protein [Thermoanaerobaculia bacterium]
MNWSIVILIIAELAFVGWLFWLFLNHRQRREGIRAEERDRLLARFTNSQELSGFLNSPAGERLFNSESRISRNAARTLTFAVTTGVILLCMAGAFYLMYWVGHPAGTAILVPAIWFVMFGLGVLISAVISALFLRRSGLLPRNGEGRGTEEP